ncbi:hypothetical protein C8Q77DRAFT_1150139 [Trametes polyzona]|nr:hypothetical protein C8Q77DRAFT_1150139 [Trametes polyzona]
MVPCLPYQEERRQAGTGVIECPPASAPECLVPAALLRSHACEQGRGETKEVRRSPRPIMPRLASPFSRPCARLPAVIVSPASRVRT